MNNQLEHGFIDAIMNDMRDLERDFIDAVMDGDMKDLEASIDTISEYLVLKLSNMDMPNHEILDVLFNVFHDIIIRNRLLDAYYRENWYRIAAGDGIDVVPDIINCLFNLLQLNRLQRNQELHRLNDIRRRRRGGGGGLF
jgi:hypothetical protein